MSPDGNNSKTSYVYDGRGSVAQTITAPVAGENVLSSLPDVFVPQIESFSYTAFGEQMNTAAKVSGFAYNAEQYDAATGMLNLRARQYEPAMNRFSQKDMVRGQIITPLTLNRYTYCINNPMIYGDPSGESFISALGDFWNQAKQTTVGKVIDTLIVQPAKRVVNIAKKVIKPIADTVANSWNKVKESVAEAQRELEKIDDSRVTSGIEKQAIWSKACANAVGDSESAQRYADLLSRIQGYNENDWLFLMGDAITEESISLEERFDILDRLKEKQDITAEDLIEIGVYTEETRYKSFCLGIFREDVAGNFAALLELSYRVTQQGTTVYELSVEEQQQRNAQTLMLLNFLGLQASLGSVQQFNAAGSAIRSPGATNAAPGYESVTSDFIPFNFDSLGSSSNTGNLAYQPPVGGGGGITDSLEANGKTITFGHGGRHIEGTNLDVGKVNRALAEAVSRNHPGTGQLYKGQISVDGITIEYTSYGVKDGLINIGTYYPAP